MTELYRIDFGFSTSKRYLQAVELAKLAHRHEFEGKGRHAWHVVCFTDAQIDLMAQLYELIVDFPRRHQEDWVEVEKKLIAERYFELLELGSKTPIDPANKPSGYIRRPIKRPHDHYGALYQEIPNLITEHKYEEAVERYYETLGDRPYGELHRELIYLKRLAGMPLTGRDLVYFLSESSRSELVASNLREYCSCIDAVLATGAEADLESPLDILNRYCPTMDELIEHKEHDWHLGVWLWDGEFKRDKTPVTLDSFSTRYGKCPEGTLFHRYPDPVQHCQVVEYPQDQKYCGLWTTYSPSQYQAEIVEKGLHLKGIEAYKHRKWRRWMKHRDPDFLSVTSMQDIKKGKYGTGEVRYTGRTHTVEGNRLYEVDLLRKNIDKPQDLGNPLLERVDEILREAENLLRETHGLPRIGEGWVSEMLLYALVREVFPEAEHHSCPEWLKPQHLDVFVPSKRLAIEYQGRQHYEPIDFFGGEESFERTKALDRRKRRTCRANGVLLIPWRYDEPLTKEMLTQKLQQVGMLA